MLAKPKAQGITEISQLQKPNFSNA